MTKRKRGSRGCGTSTGHRGVPSAKNNPFTNPEEKALEWAKMHGARFTFNGFYGTGNNWHEPIYELITPICDIQYIVTLGQIQRA